MGLNDAKIEIPIRQLIPANIIASEDFILPVATGLLAVRVINISKSFSST
jgi:hypothetical protein